MKKKEHGRSNKTKIILLSISFLLIIIGTMVAFDSEDLRLVFEDISSTCLLINFNNQTNGDNLAMIRLSNKSVDEEFRGIVLEDLQEIEDERLEQININHIYRAINGISLSISYTENTTVLRQKTILRAIRNDLSKEWYIKNIKYCGYSYDD